MEERHKMADIRPQVSVVIPTYNRSAMVVEAVHSALLQTVRDIEVIVVDDASSDDTEAAIGALRDSRIRYCRNAFNSGGSVSRNVGIRQARGRFIAFIDDDDLWRPHKLAYQLVAMGNADAILCGAVRRSDGRPDQHFAKRRIAFSDLRKGFVFGGGTSTLLARADVVKKLEFDESLPSNQDWDLMVRLAAAHRVAFLPLPLVVFNNGNHVRITNRKVNATRDEFERHLTAINKHRAVLGPFWYRYHVARRMLYYLKRRPNPFSHFAATLRRCGADAVLRVYWERLAARFARG